MGQVSKYKEEKEKLEERMQAAFSKSAEEAGKASAEHVRQMANLQDQFNKASSDSAAERADLMRRIHNLESRDSGGGCLVM